jgi:hypothetical protein
MTSRIKGPGDGPPKTPKVDGAGEVDETEGVGEASLETIPIERARAAREPALPDPLAKIADRLRAGEITADQAVELIIDDAIERQVGASAKKHEPQLRELLRKFAASDPHLVARIRRLTLLK